MKEVLTDNYAAYNGDCVEVIQSIPDNSVGLSVFSPPFPGMYAYSNTPRDMGNCRDIDEMLDQFAFLVPGLLRATMPGRRACVHLTQSPRFKYLDGYVGLKDFRGRTISLFEQHGWIYYGEVCIDKCPQLKAMRTKDSTLAMRTFCHNAERLRPALADYVLFFTKPGECPDPILAGTHPKYPAAHGWITPEEWIKWAHPVWYDIQETNVLNVRHAKDSEDEKHLCPLQLDVIGRCIKLWSAPGDTVLSPFMGIGSEGYVSILEKRKFVGIELKQSYFASAINNLNEAIQKAQSYNCDLLDYTNMEFTQ